MFETWRTRTFEKSNILALERKVKLFLRSSWFLLLNIKKSIHLRFANRQAHFSWNMRIILVVLDFAKPQVLYRPDFFNIHCFAK